MMGVLYVSVQYSVYLRYTPHRTRSAVLDLRYLDLHKVVLDLNSKKRVADFQGFLDTFGTATNQTGDTTENYDGEFTECRLFPYLSGTAAEIV